MTSKLTRERLQEIAEDGFLKHGESKELARMALAEKASEPVILYRERNPYNGLTTGWQELTENEFSFLKENAGENAEFLTLYRHAQPAPVVQPVMFIDGDISTEDADKLAKVIREFNEEDERPLAKMARIIRENPHPTNECDMPKAQPAPVVPDAYVRDERGAMMLNGKCEPRIGFGEGRNACRAAMLNGSES